MTTYLNKLSKSPLIFLLEMPTCLLLVLKFGQIFELEFPILDKKPKQKKYSDTGTKTRYLLDKWLLMNTCKLAKFPPPHTYSKNCFKMVISQLTFGSWAFGGHFFFFGPIQKAY